MRELAGWWRDEPFESWSVHIQISGECEVLASEFPGPTPANPRPTTGCYPGLQPRAFGVLRFGEMSLVGRTFWCLSALVAAGVVAGVAGSCIAAVGGSGGAVWEVVRCGEGRFAAVLVEPDISGVVVYRSSAVTSLTLSNGVRVHLKVMAGAGKDGAAAAAVGGAGGQSGAGVAGSTGGISSNGNAGSSGSTSGTGSTGGKPSAQRVSIHAFIPVRQGVTASGHVLGHEVGMLAAAVLNASPRMTGEGGADVGGAVGAGAAAGGASGGGVRQFGRACWLGADGLHIRLACEPAELAMALEKLRDLLTVERVDATVFAGTHEKELKRLREGRSAERELMDRLLGAVNPGYRRPDATVMATVTAEEVEQWLMVTLGAAVPEMAASGSGATGAAPAALAAPLDIGIAGPIDTAVAGALAAETFGDLPRRLDVLAERVATASRSGEVRLEQPAETNRGLLLLAWEAPPIHELGPYRASLGAARLLRERLRAKLQEKYSDAGSGGQGAGQEAGPGVGRVFDVSCRLMPGPELLPSTAIVRITVADAKATPGFMAELAAFVRAQLEAMASRGEAPAAATDAEADAVTDPLVADSGRFLASAEYWASTLATHRQVGLDPDELIAAPKAYDALTGADLTRAVADWLDRGPRLRVVEWPGLEK